MQALRPRRADCAATELARLPVEEQPTVSKPNFRALARATETTRSLKLRVGKQTASFLMYRLVAPMRLPRFLARMSGVKPTGRSGWKPSGMGRRAEYRQMLAGPAAMLSLVRGSRADA